MNKQTDRQTGQGGTIGTPVGCRVPLSKTNKDKNYSLTGLIKR